MGSAKYDVNSRSNIIETASNETVAKLPFGNLGLDGDL